MTTSTPLDLTVVIPTYNRSHELVRALDSLVAQTDTGFEVIVCDDGSTEDIASAIQGFHGRLRLRLMRIDNSGGPARPRNVATQAATTRWISYLDSDDWWYPSRMARLRGELNDDRDIVYHPLRVERADHDSAAKPAHGAEIGEALRDQDPVWHMIRFGNPLATSGTTVKRELIMTIGGFDESRELASVEDFDAWLRLAAQGARLQFIPEALGAYWVGSDQISTFNARQFERQRHLFHRQLALLPARYRAHARSNFGYLLGSYALDLGLPDAQSYFQDLRLTQEPLRWLKAQAKLWRAHRSRTESR
ncbi:glycosyltransferase family 2 protein [Hydrogenophaga sp.]|uniref:glycosyltransferase family 2 protein n=1 Tax=Hydrogenophaga sp. TaxID=1904254 RepID=UPI0035AF567C